MVAPSQLLECIKAQPFKPFRLHMASGKTFEIRHPEMVKLGRSFLLVFSFRPGEADIVERWETLSLESISHLTQR